MPGLFVGHQVLQHDVDSVPADAGGDDWNTQVARADIHQTRTENTRRRHARNDEEETARHVEGL